MAEIGSPALVNQRINSPLRRRRRRRLLLLPLSGLKKERCRAVKRLPSLRTRGSNFLQLGSPTRAFKGGTRMVARTLQISRLHIDATLS